MPSSAGASLGSPQKPRAVSAASPAFGGRKSAPFCARSQPMGVRRIRAISAPTSPICATLKAMPTHQAAA